MAPITNQPLRIVIGCDDAGVQYKDVILSDLQKYDGVSFAYDVSPKDTSNYANIAVAAAEAVSKGEADRAILICGTGLGVAISGMF